MSPVLIITISQPIVPAIWYCSSTGITKAEVATKAPIHQMIISTCRFILNSYAYPLISSSKPRKCFNIFPHLEHLLYSTKSKSLYILKEKELT